MKNPLIQPVVDHQAHLQRDVWSRVNVQLVRKAISEFAHEQIITPIFMQESSAGWTRYSLATDDPGVTYRFEAKVRMLDHWHIQEESVIRLVHGKKSTCVLTDLILDLKETLGIPPELLPTYLQEIVSTVHSMAYKASKETFTSKELVHAGFQEVEHAMKEGHPCFIANSGRLGFDDKAYHQYAPEADCAFKVVWVAGHVSRTSFQCIAELNYQRLLKDELGEELCHEFRKGLTGKGLDPENYLFIPIHPWQWQHKIKTIFAQDIAHDYLVYLGESDDRYSAQQSIRSLFNQDHPEKYYVKTALSILNMGFMRGLSPYYMESTPPITQWIGELMSNDHVLQEAGFVMLGEVATVGYRNLLYEPLGRKLPENKMLAALWRESPTIKITANQQLMTMASLLHVDQFETSLLRELIKASGVAVEDWVASYLNCYLKPIIHCFYQYELVFMPHGENVILVLENHVPVKAIMKDITEEVIVFNEEMELTGHVERLQKKTSDEMKLNYVFTDVFDCFFRFLSNILVTYGAQPEGMFWELVSKCIKGYQREHPELSEKYIRYDFFQPSFKRCCLNRLQLQNTKQMLDLDDPMASLKWAEEELQNPIYE